MPARVPQLNVNNLVPDYMGAHQNALRSQMMQTQSALGQQQLKQAPRRMELDEKSVELQGIALNIRKQALEQSGKPGPITIEYPDFSVEGRAENVAMVADAISKFPDQVNDPNFSAWVAQQGVSYKIREEKTGTPTELTKLINARNALPENHPERKIYDAAIAKKVQQTGEIIRMNADGSMEIIRGGAVGGDVTRKTKGAIESKIIGGKEQLARMHTIYNEFKPEYLETGTRLGAAWTSIKAKLGRNVDPQDAKTLTDFKKFQRKSIENINLYIKELTGAQMSEKEADRLRLAQPDPGENWWSGDDPITFKAKMDDVLKFTRASVARYEFYRSKGLDDNQIKAIINSDTGLNLEEMASKME